VSPHRSRGALSSHGGGPAISIAASPLVLCRRSRASFCRKVGDSCHFDFQATAACRSVGSARTRRAPAHRPLTVRRQHPTHGASAALVYDKTQSVSTTAGRCSTRRPDTRNQWSFNASLRLKFPAAFDSLALVVSRGPEVLQIYGAVRSFSGTPGSYADLRREPGANQERGFMPYRSSTRARRTLTPVSRHPRRDRHPLNWTATDASACTASAEPLPALTAQFGIHVGAAVGTLLYLSCTGSGTASQSVTVTATAAPRVRAAARSTRCNWGGRTNLSLSRPTPRALSRARSRQSLYHP